MKGLWGVKESLYEYCIRTGHEKLLEEWDTERNGQLSPKTMSYGSKMRVWWQCSRGHIWSTAVYERTSNGHNCPYCAGKKAYPGENDLASQFPEIAKEWHPTKNSGITPEQVIAGSHKKAWWICKKGHEWQAMVASRTTNGAGCPYCTGKRVIVGESDLATLYPAIAAQWDKEKNGALTPQDVHPSSNRRVWWRCERGHEYRAMIGSRVQSGSGCPYCAGRKVMVGFNDLATTEPMIAAQWHPTLNGKFTPQMVTAGSHQMVWWQCSEGHVWKSRIYSRTGSRKCGCPMCTGYASGKRQERYARLLAQAEAEKNRV